MKKLLGLCFILAAAVPFAFSQERDVAFRFFAPLDFGGTITFSPSSNVDFNYDSKFGFGLGAEVLAGVWDGLSVGAGIQGNFNRGIDDETGLDEDAAFGFVPVYGLASYRLGLGIVNPYAIVRIGYGIPTGNSGYENGNSLAGGIFFGIGGGAAIKVHGWPVQPFVEANYAYDSSGYVESKTDISYKRFQLCAGVNYGL